MTLTNLIEVLIKSIASPRTELTKEVVLGSMFPIVWFYDIKERLLFNLNLFLFLAPCSIFHLTLFLLEYMFFFNYNNFDINALKKS
jgi:hypothetical protein